MWSVLVPFKGAPGAKSRLAQDGLDDASRAALAEAFLSDVVAALLETALVSSVTIVSPRDSVLPHVGDRVTLLTEPAEVAELNGAIAWGLDQLEGQAESCAVVTGDLPFLTSAELGQVLEQARTHPWSMVPDAEGTGTAMLLLRDPRDFTPAFGEGSRFAHEALGFTALHVPATSGCRRDVDTLEQLLGANATLGRATGAVMRSLSIG